MATGVGCGARGHASDRTADLLARTGRPIARGGDGLAYPLVHFHWFHGDPTAPLWSRWIATARSIDPGLAGVSRKWDPSFRSELRAIDAVLAGQGIGIFSDVVVSEELKSGALVKAHELSLPGYRLYLVHVPRHPVLPVLAAFGVRRLDTSGRSAPQWTEARGTIDLDSAIVYTRGTAQVLQLPGR